VGKELMGINAVISAQIVNT